MPNLAEHQQQRALLDQLRANPNPQAQQQVTQLQQLYRDREMAGLADDVYDAAKGEGKPGAGWIRVSEHLDKLREYAPALQLTDDEVRDFLKPDSSGFRAEIYLPDPAVLGPGYKPTLVFKGSSGQVLAPDGLRETTGEDFLANNFPQSVGLRTDYYDRAMRLASALKRDNVDFELAGHSLGGGMASAAAAVTGARATTFNAAGLHPITPQRFAQENGLPVYDTQVNVVAYQVAGELLNDGIQQNIHRLDAFRRAELGQVLRQTSTLLNALPQGRELLTRQLNATVPGYAQPSVHAFLDRLQQVDTAQLVRELPLAAGQPQPLLAARRRADPNDPDSALVDREARLSLREVSNFGGPLMNTLAIGALGADAGLRAGRAVETAANAAAHAVDRGGDAARVAAASSGEVNLHATRTLGSAAAAGVAQAGAAAAELRQGLGQVAAGVDRLQGRVEAGVGMLGSDALRQAARVLPEGMREQVDAQAQRLEDAARQAQQRQQAEAVQALHAADRDAQRLRNAAHEGARAIGAGSQRVGEVQQAALTGVGATLDGTLDGTARSVRDLATHAPVAATAINAAMFAGTAANMQYNPLINSGSALNLAKTGVVLHHAGPSAGEATERHLMTETVVPSLDARIQEIERTTRQQAAPEHAAQQDAPAPRHTAPSVSALPTDLRDPGHPGHAEFRHSLREVHYMEAGQGIASGPHSEKVAAALLVQCEREGVRIGNVRMGADGQVQGLQQGSAFAAPKTVSIDPRQAQSIDMHDYASQWAQLRSPHLLSLAPSAVRTAGQAQGIAALPAADQAMFARIRQDTPAHIGDDHVAQAMLAAKREGIGGSEQIGRVLMVGDQLWVAGTVPGYRASTDVAQPVPPLQATVEQVRAVNQQQTMAQQRALAQQQGQDVSRGPVMA